MDAYRIGVSIALANGVSPVLAVIGRDMMHLHTSARQIEQNFSGWGRALAGVGAILAGTTILGAMVKLTKQASEFNEQLLKMKRLGGEAGEAASNGTLTKRAYEISKRVPMKVQDLMKIPGATYSIMGMHEADETWEDFAKYAYVLQADKKYKGDVSQDLTKVIRAGEMMGRVNDPVTKQIDVEKLRKFLSQASQIAAATHGQVGPDQLLAMAQQGGPTLRGLTDEGFLTMAIQAQMMGGHRAGTAYMSLWQQLSGGTMMKRTAQGMEDMGFLKPDEWSTEGGHVSITPEASKRFGKMIGEDPLAFAKAINEELHKKGITDPIEQMQAVMRMTGRQTTQRFTMEEVLALNQMIAERDRLKLGMGNGDTFKLMQNESVMANLNNVSNAWSNFVTALAGPNAQTLITALQTMTNVLNKMTDSVRGVDPATLTSIYSALGVFAAALVGIGAVLTVSLLGAPAILTALALALGTLAALNWSSISSAVSWIEKIPLIGGPISLVIKTIDMLVNAPWAKIGEGILAVYASLKPFAELAWEKLTGALNGIVGALSSFIDKILGLLAKFNSPFSNPNKGGEGGGDSVGNGLNMPMNFTPGPRETTKQQLALSLNVDGRTLAQSVSDQMENLYGFPTSAPSPDGHGRYFGGDHNMSAT